MKTESTDSRVNRTLDIIVDELDRLREARERLDARLDDEYTDESDEQHPDMSEETEAEARFDHYRVLLDQAYAFVEHVLREAMTNRDGFIAQDANEAIAGIVALRASIDEFDCGYQPEEDMQ